MCECVFVFFMWLLFWRSNYEITQNDVARTQDNIIYIRFIYIYIKWSKSCYKTFELPKCVAHLRPRLWQVGVVSALMWRTSDGVPQNCFWAVHKLLLAGLVGRRLDLLTACANLFVSGNCRCFFLQDNKGCWR